MYRVRLLVGWDDMVHLLEILLVLTKDCRVKEEDCLENTGKQTLLFHAKQSLNFNIFN